MVQVEEMNIVNVKTGSHRQNTKEKQHKLNQKKRK